MTVKEKTGFTPREYAYDHAITALVRLAMEMQDTSVSEVELTGKERAQIQRHANKLIEKLADQASLEVNLSQV